MSNSTRKPETTIRLNNCSAVIWANRSNGMTMYNTTLKKSYKDATGKWQDSDSFGAHDLPTVVAIAMMATQWIIKKQAQERDEKRQQQPQHEHGYSDRPSSAYDHDEVF